MRPSLSPNACSGGYETKIQPGPGGRGESYPPLEAELDQAGSIRIFLTASASDQQRVRLTVGTQTPPALKHPHILRSTGSPQLSSDYFSRQALTVVYQLNNTNSLCYGGSTIRKDPD